MNLDEYAMLVAIGWMSMDVAREKWADEWSDFCKSLTRWKSVHQLSRASQLLKQYNASLQCREAAQKAIRTIDEIKTQMIMKQGDPTKPGNLAEQQIRRGELKRKLSHARDTVGIIDKSGRDRDIALALSRMNYDPRNAKYDPRTDWIVYIYGSKDSAEYKELDARVGAVEKELTDLSKLQVVYSEVGLRKQMEYEKLLEKYDATKSYSMGLLVADVFYSLAAALQGDIY